MTQAEFARRVVAMQDTLYRVSTTLLPQLCDREDAVQSAIEKALRKREHLRDPDALAPWLTRILINECYALLRRRKHETLMDELPQRQVEADARPDIYQLFTSLEEKYRLPMVLYYVEGYCVKEIGSILRLPQGTVKSRLHRGRLLLRDSLALEEVQP
ncbi:MAG: sigma-70 family RNA polymerase sigma factor [Candidatus Limiplasma sp.]|nr:sigma-70 family RNA polymerase sigma factor [Clostridiales bacterium]MDY3816014.1 sigma-70 family RNA polymerase sigma factor [Candidatus Limiplasma sp.]